MCGVLFDAVSDRSVVVGRAAVDCRPDSPEPSATVNPYRMVERWPHFGNVMSGAAIGIIPDVTGGTWLHHRSEPPIMHFNAAGDLLKSFGNGMFVQAHGFCQDRDGNFWAGDSGPFTDNPDTIGRGLQMFKFSPDGKVLTLGKAGVSRVGPDTFVGPTACAIAPNGDVIVADGHWPRPSTVQQDGDRIIGFTKEGKFVRDFGRMGTKPGEFMDPHALAFDSQGRLFVADRSNNRVRRGETTREFVSPCRDEPTSTKTGSAGCRTRRKIVMNSDFSRSRSSIL